jgi:ATP-dependent 26S proteasome regulatory subunit
MKTLARSISLVVALGGGAVLHADSAAPARVLSVGEMTTRSATLRAQIGEDNQKVLAFKEQARKLKDVIKLNCVNDKQIQVKAEMNIADMANDSLQSALQKNSDDRQLAYTQLGGAADAIRRLREEAAACIGEPELFKQEQGGTVESPDIVDDPTQQNPFLGGELEPPSSASI